MTDAQFKIPEVEGDEDKGFRINVMACPFCNHPPALLKPEEQLHEVMHAVKCQNDECTVKPSVYRFKLLDAINAWNSRPIGIPLNMYKFRLDVAHVQKIQ